jgi:hypothetical protein
MDDNRWRQLQDMAYAMAFAFQQAPVPAPAPSRGPKPRAPDLFDGSDPSKLRDFLFQCLLVFDHDPDAYPTDAHQIRYAIQYLAKAAQRHFRHAYEKPVDLQPDYIHRWASFDDELHKTFGDPDIVEAAVTRLRELKMKDNHHVSRYRVEFEELASETDWDTRALYSQYYAGLADRIKDILSQSSTGKPAALKDLQDLSVAIDNRHWAREGEKSRSRVKTSSTNSTATNIANARTLPPFSSGNLSISSNRQQPPNNRASSTAPSTTSNQSRQSTNTSGTSGSGNSINNSNRSKPRTNLDNKLDENGRLLPSERQYRIKNGLCLYCGEKGHMAADCPSQKSKQSRARRANANPPYPPPPPPSAPPAEPTASAEVK